MKYIITPLLTLAICLFSGWSSVKAGEADALPLYLKVSHALFEDDFAAAKTAADKLAQSEDAGSLAASAEEVAKAATIAEARESFKVLSAEAIKVAGEGETYVVMNCPMVKGGGGDWLSADGKVNNPYYGAKMPHCGGPKK
ncbi:MAG: DUF3347 domain-containing protein [Verrucomicrobiales bacterium]|nr:DUF3347 domain-containing protein [Verrucomicrobiales bacterium]